jgi:SpoVK/Ycf46/Vps4 family AAA+-type ATPase
MATSSMIIQFECPECQELLRVKEQYAGKRARCVKCGKPIWIPRKQEQVKEVVQDRSAPRQHYAARGRDTFELVCDACGQKIPVDRSDAGERIQCPNEECLCIIEAIPPEKRKKPAGPKPLSTDVAGYELQRASAAEETLRRIGDLIRADYPFLYLVTFEEERWSSKLAELVLNAGRGLVTWSVTGGPQPRLNEDQPPRGPLEFLDQIDLYPAEHVFLLSDFHPHLADPMIRRRLRDLARSQPRDHKCILFMGPVLEIPSELERDFVVLELPLPELDDLRPVLGEVLQEVSQGRLAIRGEEQERLLRSCMGLTEPQTRKLLRRALMDQDRITDDVLWSVVTEKRQLLKGSELLEFWDSNETLGDIGGLEWLKEWLSRRVEAYSERARRFNLPQPKGVLLFGVQGCGKSLTARVAARLFNFGLVRFDVSAVLSPTRGSSEENMRAVLKTCESIAPVVLWLDEIEKGFGGVTGGEDAALIRIFGTFITWLQENRKPVFVVATANQVHNLPPELLRKGRFDELFFVDLPNIDERRDICRIHLRKRGWNPERFDVDTLAKRTDHFSGAEIEQVVLGAMYEAFGQHRTLRQVDLEDVAFATVPLAVTMEEQIDTLRQWARQRARPATPTSPIMEVIAEEAAAGKKR